MMSFRLYATAAVAAFCLAATPALAQDKPAKPAATTKPKQPAKPAATTKPAAAVPAPAANNAADDAVPQLEGSVPPALSGSQPDWVKQCQTDPQAKKQICTISRSLRSETGQTLMTAVIIQLVEDKQQVLRLIVPYGILIPNGVGLYLDNVAFGTGKFLVCSQEGCLVNIPLTEAQLGALRKAKTFSVAYKMPNQNVALALGTDGLAKTMDGKALDPQTVADEQKKLQEQLQQAAEKARKDLNAAPAAPAQ